MPLLLSARTVSSMKDRGCLSSHHIYNFRRKENKRKGNDENVCRLFLSWQDAHTAHSDSIFLHYNVYNTYIRHLKMAIV